MTIGSGAPIPRLRDGVALSAFMLTLALTACAVGPPDWESPRARKVGRVRIITDGTEVLLDAAEPEVAAVVSRIRASPLAELADCDEPVAVYVFRRRRGYLEHYPSRPWGGRAEQSSGFYSHRSRALFLPGPRRSQRTRAQFSRTLRHELVHHFHRVRCGQQPPWLEEGLADYFGRDLEGGPAMDDFRRSEHEAEEREESPTELLAETVEEWWAVDYVQRWRAFVLVHALLDDPTTRHEFARWVLEREGVTVSLSELARAVGLVDEELVRRYERTDRQLRSIAEGAFDRSNTERD